MLVTRSNAKELEYAWKSQWMPSWLLAVWYGMGHGSLSLITVKDPGGKLSATLLPDFKMCLHGWFVDDASSRYILY